MRNIKALGLAASVTVTALGQGSFSNLDFESATIIRTGNQAQVDRALPGWTVYLDNVKSDTVFYNDFPPVEVSMISIHDSTSTRVTPISGYSVFLQGGRNGSVALAQSGIIPNEARSLLFTPQYGGGTEVFFAGQNLMLFGVPGSNPTAFRVDVSAWAGQFGELRFSASSYNAFQMIDDIRFSSTAVPEPPTIALLVLSTVLLGGLRKRMPNCSLTSIQTNAK